MTGKRVDRGARRQAREIFRPEAVSGQKQGIPGTGPQVGQTAFQRYDELDFTNNYLFCKILSDEPALAKELLERILGRKISRLQILEHEKQVDGTVDGRGIRLDLYAEDDRHNAFDAEMQVRVTASISKRTRYYQSMIDQHQLDRGENFKSLRNTYIIFICMGDPFGMGRSIYTFENRCIQDPDLSLQDGTEKIFVNPFGEQENIDSSLRVFLQYLASGVPSDHFTEAIDQAVDRAYEREEWRREYMTLQMHMTELYDEAWDLGMEEGRAEGRAEGREEGREQGVEQGLQQALAVIVHAILSRDPHISEESLLHEIQQYPVYANVTAEAIHSAVSAQAEQV